MSEVNRGIPPHIVRLQVAKTVMLVRDEMSELRAELNADTPNWQRIGAILHHTTDLVVEAQIAVADRQAKWE